jgi:hypoxanthine phosphoribosyltransferase
MIKKELVSWKMVEEFIDYIVENYNNANLTGVYGLPRGGLIFAVMLSHRLNIPMLVAPIKGCLIVDDICDTGESLLHYVKNSSAKDKPEYHIVTMYYKENNLGIVPEMYSFNKENKWIVFPWEMEEE